ncbi:MAG: hypothetical protein ABI921_00515 [Panacibacter sp.]
MNYYLFHFTMFLFYNARHLAQNWRNETEKKIVLQAENYHEQMAAVHMPKQWITQEAATPGIVVNAFESIVKCTG